MTPRTRRSNKDTNFKVYYSRKVPQQTLFPHRKKTVRERPNAQQDAPEPRQLTFVPEKIRRRNTIRDSEDDDDDDEEGLEQGEHREKENVDKKKGKKRKSDVMEQEDEEDEEPVQPSSKRRRKLPKKSRPRRPTASDVPASTNQEPAPHALSSPSSTEKDENRKPRLRRQSTMTQLVDGRRPHPDDEEPDFKPVKRTSKASSGKKDRGKGKDKKQRTLTQMVPSLGSFGIVSDEDMEEELGEDEDGEAYNDALAEQFAENGVFQPEAEHGRDDENASNPQQEDGRVEEANAARRSPTPPDTLRLPEADVDDEDDEDDYHPTQHIEGPILNRRRTPRRVFRKGTGSPSRTDNITSTPRKTGFRLLATPERRKIREIPSSQSPPDSALSTQTTPRSGRLPLRERFNDNQKVQETPSKRKQVTFQEPVKEDDHRPIPLRKFGSVIQDSEEEDDLDEENEQPDEGQDTGVEAQPLIRGVENRVSGRDVGTETQAMLEQIDWACANAKEDRDTSEELGMPDHCPSHDEGSQELRERPNTVHIDDQVPSSPPQTSPYRSAHTGIKQEPQDGDVATLTLPRGSEAQGTSDAVRAADFDYTIRAGNAEPQVRKPALKLKQNPQSSPVVIKDEPGRVQESLPTLLQQSTDLDGEPIQVARSPTSLDRETQNTIQSHSSRAEQQLQSEWLSYSQYQRPLHTSSMNVVQDISSYQATPFSDHTTRAPAPPHSSAPLSQATTVDCTQRSPHVTPRKSRVTSTDAPRKSRITSAVTPKKSRITSTNVTPATSRIVSATTTPHKIPSSQPMVSPGRLPSLVIPSSYPSPGKVSVRDWSSPVLGASLRSDAGAGGGLGLGLGSIEDFSIPPFPPVWQDDDEEL